MPSIQYGSLIAHPYHLHCRHCSCADGLYPYGAHTILQKAENKRCAHGFSGPRYPYKPQIYTEAFFPSSKPSRVPHLLLRCFLLEGLDRTKLILCLLLLDTMFDNSSSIATAGWGSAYENVVHLMPPFYHTSRAALLPFMSDYTLSMAIGVVLYWVTALFYYALDHSGWVWLESYRIHDSEEMKNQNLVRKRTVIYTVLSQQAVQILLGICWMEEEVILGEERHLIARKHIESIVLGLLRNVLGNRAGDALFVPRGEQVAHWLYWWGIPAAQFLFALFFIDTWQYFWHRLFHISHFLYRHVHSVHHRVYAPFAFAAQYNHPVEGFVLDTLGAVLAQWASYLTVRQSCLLFAFATIKGVHDHGGYRLPWDPLQLLFGSNADFHDIHHQRAGLKYNFSTPFFSHWDIWLGTHLTREQLIQKQMGKQIQGKAKTD